MSDLDANAEEEGDDEEVGEGDDVDQDTEDIEGDETGDIKLACKLKPAFIPVNPIPWINPHKGFSPKTLNKELAEMGFNPFEVSTN